ncbi:MAG: MG2 domain-containing protein [Vicingaceae bacterium]
MKAPVYRWLIPAFFSFFLFFSCGDNQDAPPPIDPAFTNYIKGFTAGVVSNQSTIKISLTEANARAKRGEEVSEDLFDFSPDIKGKAFWEDNYTIEFKPEERLPSGVIYDVEFELGELQEVPEKLETFEFRFQTITQDLIWVFEGMEAYQDHQLQWQQLSGTVQTADYTELVDLQKTLTATQDGEELSLSWEYLGSGNVYKVKIDSVSRKKEAEEVIVAWNGEPIEAASEGEELITIPALDDFKVMSVQVEQLPEQKITVNFSDPISRTQDLNGLIYTMEADEFRIAKERNTVSLYPVTDLSGDRELVISKGVKNTLGYDLKEEKKKDINFSSMKPEVAFIGKGNILPGTDGFKLPIKAVNLSGLNVKVVRVFEDNIVQFFQSNQYDGSREMKRVGRVIHKETISLIGEKGINYGQWNSYEVDLSKMIKTEPGAIYQISVEFDQSQSLYPCEGDQEVSNHDYTLSDAEKEYYDSPNAYYWDYYNEYYDYQGEYNYQDRNNPCTPSYYSRGNHTITTNVLASNLGLIAKSGDENEFKVAVTDLRTAEPISGAKIEIYNFQQQLMQTVESDQDGFATIPLEGKPFLLVASHGSEKGYLRLDDGSALSLSMFDVSGEENQKGVKGFVYGERGVWRPGDSLYLTFILEDKNQSLPKEHPVVFELHTPENQLYSRQVKNEGTNGFYDLRTATEQDAPTGNWMAKVKVGNSTFYKRIKIKAIKPNRLKINLDFEEKVLSKGKTTGQLSAKWLHGADANGLRAVVEMNLTAGNTKFENYEEYNFDDPVKTVSVEEKTVFDDYLNVIGETAINPEIEVGKEAPGQLIASFKTRVFEKGGDFSIDRFKVPFSPFKSYVGVRIPEGKGWNGALYSNESNLIPIVSVDAEGNPIDRKALKVEIFDVKWRWWWERSQGDDLARYVVNRSKNLIKSETINTEDGKALYQLTFDKNRWGRKFIRITDPVSGHSTGATFYLTYKGWWDNGGADNPGGAEMLSFKARKDKYELGETVELEVPDIKEGRLLVSLESGSKIIKQFWKTASELEGGLSFKATKDMAPNVYAHLTLIQPHANTANDLPIRMYGVQNIAIEAPETHLNPVLEMPDELAPEQEVELTVSEKDGKAMTYTIAVVDEGLLDLTRFQTPNPWPHFYKREALGIKSWDMYDYVMGAFSGEVSGLLALGGDNALNPGEGNKANRFEPVVEFLGPFELGEGDESEHKFTMPNYIGSVRTMVIAGDRGAYGATDKTTPVKKPLMVLATLPRVVSPGEKLKLPVTVFAMQEGMDEVEVSIETNELFKVTENRKTINFSKIGDKLVYFDIEVKEEIGVGKVKVEVEGSGESARHEIEIQSRLPNLEIDKTISAVIEAGKSWTAEYKPIGIEGTNLGAIEVSAIPTLNLEKRLNYLIRYPHGCIEQTTSAAFPQLYLSDLMELSNERQNEIQSNVMEALNRLRSFQLNNGGFSYWPGYTEVNAWGTNYAGHFMLEAKKKGYALPSGLLQDWLKHQARMANSWTPKTDNYSSWSARAGEFAQAYRLYTLALAGKPAIGAMNRLRERASLFDNTKWRLAAAYTLVGKKEVAKSLVAGMSSEASTQEVSYSYGSKTRNDAMILETLQLLGEKLKGKKVLDRISKNLSSEQWMSTQTTAFSLLAVAQFVAAEGEDQGLNYELEIAGEDEAVETDHLIQLTELPMKKAAVKLTNKSNRTLFVQLNLSGVPISGEKIDEQSRLSMQVQYLNLDGTTLDPTTLRQGADFMAEVSITHPGGAEVDYKDMALSQLFPSGWEIRNWRMDETTSPLMRDQPDYQDIRDDRVYSYFDLQKRESKTFRVLLNAAYLGRFYLPAVECSAMYDNDIHAVKSGKWVEVVAQ